jgi:hypothetical protein
MGGPGSGCSYYHHWRPAKKSTVEDCRSLDANQWMREGVLRAGVWHFGSWSWWRDTERREQTASLGYEVDTRDPAAPSLRLSYTIVRTGEALDYRVGLTTTRPRFGGLRWWFICPLVVNGSTCARRVGKLYLPPGGRYYGCRHCYDLTYTSCQQHDKRVDFLRRNPEVFQRLMANLEGASIAQLGLLLKATKF